MITLKSDTSGIVFDIKKFAIHDGPGIRTTVFFKGCPLKCEWCHNPESQKHEIEHILKNPIDSLHNDNSYEQIGKKIRSFDLIDEIKKDVLFYDESEGGVTFSGGDPLSQHEFLKSCLQLCKENEIHTALDTAGYLSWSKLKEIIPLVDLVLYDLKFVDEPKHKKYTGVSNKMILENLSNLSAMNKAVWIRIPIIPTLNDTEDEIHQMINFISRLNNIGSIDLLPFHKIGKNKYQRLNLPYKMENFFEPSLDRMEELKRRFETLNIPVKIGG
ncbi:Choline trimethylamine-lyase activating enzyme [Candidatus Lokiarchaeum ossiferum]